MTRRTTSDEMAVFSLESGRPMADRICERLDIVRGDHEEREFGDGEFKIRALEPVRGRDVYLVQSLYGDGDLGVNDRLMRTLFFAGSLRDAGARRVTVLAPYLCYSRKDLRTKLRDPVTTRYVASLFEAVGVDRMVTVDVHNRAAFENAFRIPTVHLTAAHLFADELKQRLEESEDVAVVSPDAGGVKRAEIVRQTLHEGLGREVGSAFVEKFRSEGVVRGGRLVGDVDGRTALIVDDLISSGTTLVRAAKACRERGARRVFAAVTHGVFSDRADDVLAGHDLDGLFVVDTLPAKRIPSGLTARSVHVLPCAPLLAAAVERLALERSLSALTSEVRGRAENG